MGVTQQGNLLDWTETKKYVHYVRQEGIKQFINLYRKVKDRTAEAFKWGDEIEHILIKLDDVEQTARLLPKTPQILPHLNRISTNECRDSHGSIWMPEYGTFQLESTPGRPFENNFSIFGMVESNMALRRQQVKSVLDGNNGEVCLTMTHLPRFGCPNSCILPAGPNCSKMTKSPLYPDATISQFGRYTGLEMNTRQRRGERVSIKVPVYKDTNTPSAIWDQALLHQSYKATGRYHIHADCTVAAVTCSSLQVTFQTSDVSQAKYLYDQLIPICPIMLALSASSPLFRGFLADVDCRWNAVSASVDARNREERNIEPLQESKFVIPKPNFGTPSFYLSAENESLSDIVAPYDEERFQQLVNGGVDVHLARHIAHMFIHGPIILYEENIVQTEEDTGHFEVQLTDFENAAYVIFIMLLVRAIDKFKLDLAIPISKVDLNMEEAQTRDAVREKTFYFKENVESSVSEKNDISTRMTIDVIINGGVLSSGEEFRGLIPIIKRYITTQEDADEATRATVSCYLELISDRAAGRVNTTARWIRNMVEKHPDYKHDSVISERINYDLVKLFSDISNGTVEPQHLKSART